MTRLSEQRLRKIMERQSPMGWGSDYQPALQVRRGEAPRTSRPSIIYSDKLGRQMHLMSQSEQIVAILVLFSKTVFEVHEQRMLPVWPEQHPLADYFRAQGLQPPSTRGTVEIADQLGCLGQHPIVRIEEMDIPYPYLGDQLIFSRDEYGPFCVDISVKKSMKDFYRKHGAIFTVGKKSKKQRKKEENRHKIQQVLNDQLGIKMVFAAGDSFDKELRYNLTHLFKWHAREVNINEASRQYMLSEFKVCLESGAPPQSIMKRVSSDLGCGQYEFNAVFFQSIWRQELRPDLYSCLQINRVMTPEKRNPIVEYSNWFTR